MKIKRTLAIFLAVLMNCIFIVSAVAGGEESQDSGINDSNDNDYGNAIEEGNENEEVFEFNIEIKAEDMMSFIEVKKEALNIPKSDILDAQLLYYRMTREHLLEVREIGFDSYSKSARYNWDIKNIPILRDTKLTKDNFDGVISYIISIYDCAIEMQIDNNVNDD